MPTYSLLLFQMAGPMFMYTVLLGACRDLKCVLFLQRVFEENRNAELVEMQRLEEQERRKIGRAHV